MTNNILLQDFTPDEDSQCFRGKIFVPFLGAVLPVILIMDWNTKQPDAKGVEMLQTIISYNGNFREDLTEAIFDYYINEIYGTFDQYDRAGNNITDLVAPQITEPDQIWPMLERPCIEIRSYRPKASIEFSMSFKCQWDKEHGCGVLCRDWQVVEVGGAGDV